MMKHKLFLTLALVGVMSPMAMRAEALQVDPTPQAAPAATPGPDEALYTAGTKAMDEQRWADAVTTFDKVAAAKGKHADAAIYWKAYSLDKLGKKDEAQSVCDSLRQQQPSSAWNKECIVLRVRGSAVDARQVAEQERELVRLSVDPRVKVLVGPNGDQIYKRTPHETSEDDIKLLAINALLQQEPAKALPLLHDLILSDKPIEVRK